jgi:hypothetical protein
MMKSYLYKLCFSLCGPALLFAASCKNDDPLPAPVIQNEWIDNPQCSIENSRLVEVTEIQDGVTKIRMYEYDSENRITRILLTYPAQNVLQTFLYYGDTLIVSEKSEYPEGDFLLYRFDSLGRQVQTFLTSPIRSNSKTNFFYNVIGELTSTATYTQSKVTYLWDRIDTTTLTWADGNLVTEDWGETRAYEYFPNTDGRFLENTPEQSARWLYVPFANPVTSRNFVKRKEESGFTKAYIQNNEAFFDDQGRPNHIYSTTSHHSNPSKTVKKIYYRYKCI